mmetsp:Transcript_46611/g.117993  ORF Transcript_46611/g.117993 Transcript_46611/m.117993 type:complete len:314 (+) Transcript_46611:138-1079(+)
MGLLHEVREGDAAGGRLVEPDQLPPDHAHDAPDGKVEHRAVGALLPQLRQLHVARAEVHRGLPAGKVGHAAKEVGVEAERERGQHGRRARGHHHAQEGGVERAHMGGLAREKVMQDVVPDVQDAKRLHPAELHRGERGGHGAREPADDAERVELRAERDEDGEPHQRVPRALLLQRVVPGHHARGQQDDQADHGGQHRRDAELGAEDPQHHGDAQPAQHLLLRVLQPAHGRQLLRGLHGCLRGVLHAGRVDQVDQVGRQYDGDQARHARRNQPLAEGVGEHDARLLCELDAQEVLRGGGEQDGAGVVAALQLL